MNLDFRVCIKMHVNNIVLISFRHWFTPLVGWRSDGWAEKAKGIREGRLAAGKQD